MCRERKADEWFFSLEIFICENNNPGDEAHSKQVLGTSPDLAKLNVEPKV